MLQNRRKVATYISQIYNRFKEKFTRHVSADISWVGNMTTWQWLPIHSHVQKTLSKTIAVWDGGLVRIQMTPGVVWEQCRSFKGGYGKKWEELGTVPQLCSNSAVYVLQMNRRDGDHDFFRVHLVKVGVDLVTLCIFLDSVDSIAGVDRSVEFLQSLGECVDNGGHSANRTHILTGEVCPRLNQLVITGRACEFIVHTLIPVTLRQKLGSLWWYAVRDEWLDSGKIGDLRSVVPHVGEHFTRSHVSEFGLAQCRVGFDEFFFVIGEDTTWLVSVRFLERPVVGVQTQLFDEIPCNDNIWLKRKDKELTISEERCQISHFSLSWDQFDSFWTKPKVIKCQISPAASPEIWHHTVWRTWLFIAYSD